MKANTVRLVKAADETSDLRPHNAFERLALGRDDMNVDLARAQRCGNFETDEARTDDDRTLRRRSLGDDCPAVRERAEIVDLRRGCARDFQAHRIGAGSDQQSPELVRLAVLELDASLANVEHGDARIEHEVDPLLAVEVG